MTPLPDIINQNINKYAPAMDALAKGEEMDELTPEQIENWRKVLFGMIGSFAWMVPAEEIQKFRDKMQANIDKCEAEKETK